ncbi:MAG: AarF/ABC1/UbiB kinase family protein [bacterium]|nr:AarF/ABC1/UbiB kinase family protein [bacterium]
MGLLAVKIGQVHALRIDFLSEEKCRELSKLYRHTISIPPEDFFKTLKQLSTPEFIDLFEKIEEKPLASASVGQVHKARLKSGKDVVVKLVKENFKKDFIRDVRSVRRFFKFIIFFYRKLQNVADPIGILNHIEEYTTSELDLRNEIQGQKILREIYLKYRDNFDLSKLMFTQVYEDISNENIMVSDFVEGKTIDELLDEGKLEYQKLLDLFHIHGFYMFVVGTFHGDIHPGNIILNGDKLFFVDTGAIGYVGDKIRTGLFNFFEALSWFDYEKCAFSLNKMAEREITGEKFKKFEGKFRELYKDFENSTVSQVSLTRKMMETIKLGVNSGMIFEQGIFSIIKSLMYMDGMVLRCNPEAILMKDMRIFIQEFKKIKKIT